MFILSDTLDGTHLFVARASALEAVLAGWAAPRASLRGARETLCLGVACATNSTQSSLCLHLQWWTSEAKQETGASLRWLTRVRRRLLRQNMQTN